MKVEEFERTTSMKSPPSRLSAMLEALWFARRGDWDRAHAIVQEHENDADSALVHAHLHRVEGDLSNAGYWYRNAGRNLSDMTLDDEWKALAAQFLKETKR